MIEVRVVTLASRPERYRAFRRQWDASGWSAVVPDPRPFDAVDGSAGRIPAGWEPYGAGAWGCWASHLEVVRRAALAGSDVLVLEDDAVIAPDSAEALAAVLDALPPYAAGVWLGGQIVESALERRGGPIFRVRRAPLRTHAYLLTGRGIACALQHLPYSVGHIDNEYPRALAGAPVYAVDPWLVGQRAGRSDITHANEPERWWPLDPTRS